MARVSHGMSWHLVARAANDLALRGTVWHLASFRNVEVVGSSPITSTKAQVSVFELDSSGWLGRAIMARTYGYLVA